MVNLLGYTHPEHPRSSLRYETQEDRFQIGDTVLVLLPLAHQSKQTVQVLFREAGEDERYCCQDANGRRDAYFATQLIHPSP